ncbi:MAG: TonB-dependent receptor [Mesonia sp.]|uniref:TonB-dependent receptor n=1 Tax=Mesonia sp. TaxID=1960830 RepID=UPI003F990720
MKRFFFLLFLVSAGAQDVLAQEDASQLKQLSGEVLFKDGNPVVSALVYIKENGKSVYTGEEGEFMLKNLEPAIYHVIIQPFGKDEIKVTSDLRYESDVLHIQLQEEEDFALEDVIIKTKSKGRLTKEKGYSVEVVSTKELALQSLGTTEILDRSAGVKIRQSAGLGSDINFNLNGLSGNSVRVFIDGIPIRNYGKAFSLSSIPPSMIERIEVYKGVLPGELTEDALGGGINVILKKENKNSLTAAYTFGSFNTHQADVQGNYYHEKTGINTQLSAFYTYTDNNYEVYGDNVYVVNPQTGKVKYVKADRFHDTFESKGIKADIGVRDKSWADELTLGLLYSDIKNDIQTGATMDVVYGNRRSESDSKMINLRYTKEDLFTKGLSANTFTSYSQTNRKVIDTVPVMYNWFGEIIRDQNGDPVNWNNSGGEAGRSTLANNDEKNLANRTGLSYEFMENHYLKTNFFYNQFTRDIDDPELPKAENELLDTRFLSKTIWSFTYEAAFFDEKLTTTAFYKNYRQKVELTDLQKNNNNTITEVKYDKSIDNNGYGLALSYELTPKILLMSSAEKAIRMPGIFELLGNTSENVLPTYDLKPEKSNNLNLGASFGNFVYKKHRLKADVNFFLRDISDMIVRGISSNITDKYGFENLGKVRSTGVDVELNYNYNKRFNLTANFSNFNARYNLQYDDYGSEYVYYRDRLRNAPYLTLNTYAEYKFLDVLKKGNNLNVNYNFGYTHEFFRNWESLASKGKAYIPTQAIHSFGVNYSMMNQKLTIGVNAKNITDQQVFDNWALQKPGRAFYLKLTYKAI